MGGKRTFGRAAFNVSFAPSSSRYSPGHGLPKAAIRSSWRLRSGTRPKAVIPGGHYESRKPPFVRRFMDGRLGIRDGRFCLSDRDELPLGAMLNDYPSDRP